MNYLTEAQAKTFLKKLRLSNFQILPSCYSDVHIPFLEIPLEEYQRIQESMEILYELHPASIWNEREHDYDSYLEVNLSIDSGVKSFAVSLTSDFVFALLQSKQIGFTTKNKNPLSKNEVFSFGIDPRYFETLQEFLKGYFRF